jgi:nitroreductase
VELGEILARRRMHRSFLRDPLPREQLERIAAVVRRAPSGGFAQGTSIVVVTEAERRREIAARFELPDGFVADAPAHLVVCVSEARYHARYNEPDKLAATGGVEVTWPVPYWFVDAGALLMLLLLAAIDEGLASAFVGHPDQKRILGELLALPDDVVPIGVALVGKPGPAPPAGSRLRERRRPLADLVHWERW